MVTPPIPAGTVLPLVREVTGSPDPLALYHALSDGGRAPGTFLLESAETGAGSGERSLLGVSAALRVACSGRIVEIKARSANGRSLLPWIARRLEQQAPDATLTPELFRASFPEPPPGATFDGPVLWVAGANSTYVLPDDRARMDELFPATRLVRIKNAGHWVHSEQPEVFLETLRRFLDLVER